MIKKNYKYILLIIFGVIFQTTTYFISKFTPLNIHTIGSNFDKNTPFISYFIYFYALWYIMIFLVPFFFVLKNKESFAKYETSLLICSLLSLFIFTLYPTTMERGSFPVEGITTFIVSLIYKIDTPILNCFPSMHCVLCFLFIFTSLDTNDLNKYEKGVIIFLSIMVILSTLFVKQHVIIDVISAFIISLVIYYIVTKTKIYKKLFKKLKLKLK